MSKILQNVENLISLHESAALMKLGGLGLGGFGIKALADKASQLKDDIASGALAKNSTLGNISTGKLNSRMAEGFKGTGLEP